MNTTTVPLKTSPSEEAARDYIVGLFRQKRTKASRYGRPIEWVSLPIILPSEARMTVPPLERGARL